MSIASAQSAVLAELDDLMAAAFGCVHRELVGATRAFLSGERDDTRRVFADDGALDELHGRIQAVALDQLIAAPGRNETEVRALVTIVRVAPELERSGDLATHIASIAGQRLATWLTPRALDLISQMGEIGAEMWLLAAAAYANRDTRAVGRLRQLDDEIDDLHVSLITELAAMPVTVPVAVQLGLVARYLERLGDHAFNVSRQLHALTAPG